MLFAFSKERLMLWTAAQAWEMLCVPIETTHTLNAEPHLPLHDIWHGSSLLVAQHIAWFATTIAGRLRAPALYLCYFSKIFGENVIMVNVDVPFPLNPESEAPFSYYNTAAASLHHSLDLLRAVDNNICATHSHASRKFLPFYARTR